MASVEFQTGSEEWMMFKEYYALCKKYWIPEKDDAWWDEALAEIDAFAKKYGSTVFVRGMCMALVNHLEVENMNRKQTGRT